VIIGKFWGLVFLYFCAMKPSSRTIVVGTYYVWTVVKDSSMNDCQGRNFQNLICVRRLTAKINGGVFERWHISYSDLNGFEMKE
jgi:hypothetical protein